jgi:hypothetical protein
MTVYETPSFRPPPGPYVPWSGAAVAGFVLSWLGCTIVGGVLGLILAIVALFDTGGGRRRGRGLAIAAIPISLLTGGLSVCLALILFNVFQVLHTYPDKLMPVLGPQAGDVSVAAASLRALADDSFNRRVAGGKLEAWLGRVLEKHGTLVGHKVEISNPRWVERKPSYSSEDSNEWLVTTTGKFVNGETNIKLTIDISDLFKPQLMDIEIDGDSPTTGAPDSGG